MGDAASAFSSETRLWKLRTRPLLVLLLLLVHSACAPMLRAGESVDLTLSGDRLTFQSGGDLDELNVYAEGEDLRLTHDRCQSTELGWHCSFAEIRRGTQVELPLTGSVSAAAALWDADNDSKPYSLLTVAGGKDDGTPAPRQLGELVPDRSDHPWVGDPGFDVENLPEDVRPWHRDTVELIDEGEMYEYASSGDLYHVARPLNLYITALLLGLSETGDLRMLDGVDQAMQRARDELRDEWRNGREDGYLGWLYLDRDSDYFGQDDIELDDMMAHGMVAAVAYAYYLNRFNESPSGVDYNERFEFWSDYLINHYEAKWRERTGREDGFPFVEKDLVHPTVGMVRYLYYMGLLGYEDHLEEAEELASDLGNHFKRTETPGGDAYVYDHGYGSDEEYGLAPTTYARYTMPMLLELAINGLEPYDEESLSPFANTIAYLLLDEDDFSLNSLLAADVGGAEERAGIEESEFVDEDDRYDGNRFPSLVPFARFDESGRIMEAALEVYDDLELFRLVLAAGMVYALND